MLVLCISDGRINSNISLLEFDSANRLKSVFSVDEERVSRRKNDGGFPELALKLLIEKEHFHLDDINAVVFGGIVTPNLLTRAFRGFGRSSLCNYSQRNFKNFFFDFFENRTGLTHFHSESLVGKLNIPFLKLIAKGDLPPELRTKPIFFIDHHLAHAASAYHCSDRNRLLVFTCDGLGDGVSFTTNVCENGQIRRIFEISPKHSFGRFYAMITSLLGFKPQQHEGKVTGLAAYGDCERVKVDFPFEIVEEKESINVRYTSLYGIKGIKHFSRILDGYKKEDIAAWLQKGTEECISRIVKFWIEKTQIKNIGLAGGVFANVKLNQRVHELPNVDYIFIFPHMNDAGIGFGAALAHIKPTPFKLKNVFFGPSYDNCYIENLLKRFGLKFYRSADVERRIAGLLARGKIVGRFAGRMEYGPRALGNRSILYKPTDSSVNKWLNEKLKRTEFMPFAPAVLSEDAKKCFKNLKGAEYAVEFMTTTFECTNFFKRVAPAAVHVDGTARPQLVTKQSNPSFYRIIKIYKALTGIPAVINTSFNMHEEPIVCSPEDALRAFAEAELDFLALENYLIPYSSDLKQKLEPLFKTC